MIGSRRIWLVFALAAGSLLAAAGSLPAGAQALVTIHSFGGNEGAQPQAALCRGADGNFYGTTVGGGARKTGTVFRLSPSGQVATLHSFPALKPDQTNRDGAYPWAGLVQGSDGAFYGTAAYGGAYQWGTVFKITPDGAYTVLHAFDHAEGRQPWSGLVQGSDGAFYGTTFYGGLNDTGTIFTITPDGTLTTLYSFTPLEGEPEINADGANPFGNLTQGSDGAFYGTTILGGSAGSGTIFRITPDGVLTTLYAFSAVPSLYPETNADGAYPYGGLIQGSDGCFYGVATDGGQNGSGTIFQITQGGVFSCLHSFTALTAPAPIGKNPDGAIPYGSLLQGSDGAFYGTASAGGYDSSGTLFRMAPGGALTTLHFFAPDSSKLEGIGPYSNLVQGADGNFYGTTQRGGAYNRGTAFVLIMGNAPVFTAMTPTTVNAGGPAFTLTVDGHNFSTKASVTWNGARLTTTYVSPYELKAIVPAALIANPGSANVEAVNPGPGGGASLARNFTIATTSLKLLSATLTRDSTTGAISAILLLQNTGYLTAPNVSITQAILKSTPSDSALPLNLADLAAGASTAFPLTFPATAGASGTSVKLKIAGTFAGGTFSGTLNVTLP